MAKQSITLIVAAKNTTARVFRSVKDGMKDLGHAARSGMHMLRNAFLWAGAAVAGFALTSKWALGKLGEKITAETKLANALRTTGAATEANVKRFNDEAAAIQRTTIVSEDAAKGVMAILQATGEINPDNVIAATRALVDLGSALGKDEMQQIAIQLSKALSSDPEESIDALSRAGIRFTKVEERSVKQMKQRNQLAEAQAFIIKKVAERYEGYAAAIAATPTGRITQLKNQLDDLVAAATRGLVGGMGLEGKIAGITKRVAAITETIGPKLAPYGAAIGKAVEDIVKGGKDREAGLKALSDMVAQVWTATKPMAVEAGKALGEAAMEAFKALAPGWMKSIGRVIGGAGRYAGGWYAGAGAAAGEVAASSSKRQLSGKALYMAGPVPFAAGMAFDSRFRNRVREAVSPYFGGGGQSPMLVVVVGTASVQEVNPPSGVKVQ